MDKPSIPKPSRNRSKRLRKKLYLEEFQLLEWRCSGVCHGDPEDLLDPIFEYADPIGWSPVVTPSKNYFAVDLLANVNDINQSAVDEFMQFLKANGVRIDNVTGFQDFNYNSDS